MEWGCGAGQNRGDGGLCKGACLNEIRHIGVQTNPRRADLRYRVIDAHRQKGCQTPSVNQERAMCRPQHCRLAIRRGQGTTNHRPCAVGSPPTAAGKLTATRYHC